MEKEDPQPTAIAAAREFPRKAEKKVLSQTQLSPFFEAGKLKGRPFLYTTEWYLGGQQQHLSILSFFNLCSTA